MGVTKCIQQLKNTRSSALFNPALTEIAIHAATQLVSQQPLIRNSAYMCMSGMDVTKRLMRETLQVVLPNISGGICRRSCYQTSQVGYVAGRVTKTPQVGYVAGRVTKTPQAGCVAGRVTKTPQAGYVAGRVTKTP